MSPACSLTTSMTTPASPWARFVSGNKKVQLKGLANRLLSYNSQRKKKRKTYKKGFFLQEIVFFLQIKFNNVK